jgi:hypothetical protein
MSKEKLFEYYLLKNPSLVNQLVDGKVVMSAKGFKKFFETTYDVAYKEAICDCAYNDEPYPVNLAPKQVGSEDDTLKDLLNIFGMR